MKQLQDRLHNLTPVETIVIYGLIFVLTTGYYVFFMGPKMSQLRNLEQRVSEAEVRASLRESEERALSSVTSQLEQMEEFLVALQTHLSTEPRKERIVEQVRVLAEKTGVNVTMIRFNEVEAFLNRDELDEEDNEFLEMVKRLPVGIRAQGDWENLHLFVYALRGLSGHIHFQSLNVRPTDYGHDMEALLHMIFMEGGN